MKIKQKVDILIQGVNQDGNDFKNCIEKQIEKIRENSYYSDMENFPMELVLISMSETLGRKQVLLTYFEEK